MNWWQRWKARHWAMRLENDHISRGNFSPGYEVAPPLRRLARWTHANGWKLTTAFIAAVAAAAALQQSLRCSL